MKVDLSVGDFLRRAEQVFGARTAFIDEPDQPAASWGLQTYAQMAQRARAQAAALDRMGIARGARVAVVSQNSARLLTSFFGVSAFGRVLVPINFRLVADEIDYIVRHCGAEVLLVDPELADGLQSVKAKHKFVIGADSDEVLYDFDREPETWAPDELATATINYTSGTTARPKGVQLTHRTLWMNATMFGWHMGVNDRDVYMHTLPQFHVNGWGMVYAVTSMGGTHIILRKVDGDEILRRVDRHGVTLLCGASRRQYHYRRGCPHARLAARQRGRTYGDCWCAAAGQDHRATGNRSRLAVQPDLWAHRNGPSADDQPHVEGVRVVLHV